MALMATFLRMLIWRDQIYLKVSHNFINRACNWFHHWNWHRYDQKISNDIGGSEDGQHIQGVGALGQEKRDWCPVKTPIHSTLEDCRQKKGQAPCRHDCDHDPASCSECTDMAEDATPEKQNGQLDEAKSNLFCSLESIFVL